MTYTHAKIALAVGFFLYVLFLIYLSSVAFDWTALHRTFTKTEIERENLHVIWRDKRTTTVRFSNTKEIDVGSIPGLLSGTILFGGGLLYPSAVLTFGNRLNLAAIRLRHASHG